MTPGEIAEEVELSVGDALADLAMVSTAVKTSKVWDYPPSDPDTPLRIKIAERWLGGWPRADWRDRLASFDSPGMRTLTQQWIVAVYSKWEEVDRKRLTDAGNDGMCDVFGDLRHLRNDIVHHKGIASSGNAG